MTIKRIARRGQANNSRNLDFENQILKMSKTLEEKEEETDTRKSTKAVKLP